MASYNKLILVGRLTKDPEVKYSSQGTQTCKFTIAVDRGYKDNKKTDFFNLVSFGKTADVIAQYAKKGSLNLFECELQTNNYEDKDGKKVYTFNIIAQKIEMLSSNSNNSSSNDNNILSNKKPIRSFTEEEADEITQEDLDYDDEDLPF